MAFSYYYARDYDKAIELLNQAKQLNPDYLRTYEFLYFVYREKGMFIEAIDSTEKLFDEQFRRGARTEQDHKNLKIFVKELKNGAIKNGAVGFWQAYLNNDFARRSGPYNIAVAHAKLGETDQAFEALNEAEQDRFSGMVWLKVDPEFQGIRADERFQKLLQRVGI